MSTAPNQFRYVAAGSPSLLETYEQALAACGLGAGNRLTILARRPETIRQMLRHERTMYVMDFMRIKLYVRLSYEEAMARYLANAPAELIRSIERVGNEVGQLQTLADAMKVLKLPAC